MEYDKMIWFKGIIERNIKRNSINNVINNILLYHYDNIVLDYVVYCFYLFFDL